LIRSTLKKLRFEALDHHLGMMLGGIEGAGLGLLATVFLVSLLPQTRQPVFSSPTGRVVGVVMDAVGPMLPGEFKDLLIASRRVDAQANTGDDSQAPSNADPSELEPVDLAADESTEASDPATRQSALTPAQPVVSTSRKPPVGASSSRSRSEKADLPPSKANLGVVSEFLDNTKAEFEEAIVESLDPDDEAKARSLKELAKKQRDRLGDAVAGQLNQTRQKVNRSASNRLERAQIGIDRMIDSAVNRARHEVDEVIRSVEAPLTKTPSSRPPTPTGAGKDR
jgi:membrane protein required for colicin V production